MRRRFVRAVSMAGFAAMLLAAGGASGPGSPEEAFLEYREALRAGRYDAAMNRLGNGVGQEFFETSFRYARDEAATTTVAGWNAAISGKEEILKRLPYWKYRETRIELTRTLRVGRHARIWFQAVSDVTPAGSSQDLVLEEGEWRLIY